MEVNYLQACEMFNKINSFLRVPSLHPNYVLADSARDSELKPIFWVYKKDENVFYYPFHLSKIYQTGFYDIQSQYGYGGPVSNSSDEIFLRSASAEFKNWCNNNKVMVEFVRFHPMIDNSVFYHGLIKKNRDTVYMDLRIDNLLESYSTRSRTAIRKAIKNGLSVEVVNKEKMYDVFPCFYREQMININADEFYLFPDRYFKELFNMNNVMPIICFYNGELVSAAIILYDDVNAEYHLSATNELGRKYCATNMVIHMAAEMLKAKGVQRFHLGGGTNEDSLNPLLFFKKSFSDLKSEFKIGYHIHNQSEYNKLKIDYVEQGKSINNRILFYRY